jgi:hypothetical protein
MKIKNEYKGKTLIKTTSLGNTTVVVDNINVKAYQYYVSIGLGFIFEKDNTSATAPIRYEGIEADEQTDAPVVTKPKTKRKRANGQS